jgi:hypothetical protein
MSTLTVDMTPWDTPKGCHPSRSIARQRSFSCSLHYLRESASDPNAHVSDVFELLREEHPNDSTDTSGPFTVDGRSLDTSTSRFDAVISGLPYKGGDRKLFCCI